MSADDLRLEIAASRRAIQANYEGLRNEFDFASKAKRAVVKNPLPWLGGAAILGYLLSPGKKQREARPSKHAKSGIREEIAEPAKKLTLLGMLMAAFRLLFPLVRPMAVSFATRQLTQLARRYQP